jgi:hypothetical protein
VRSRTVDFLTLSNALAGILQNRDDPASIDKMLPDDPFFFNDTATTEIYT